MKKLLLCTILTFSLISCTQQSKVEKFITKTVSEKLDDPSSFELVKVRIIEKSKIQSCKDSEKLNLDMADLKFSSNKEFGVNEHNQAIALYQKNIERFELVEKGVMLYVDYTFRAKNKMGAIVTDTKSTFIPIDEL